MFASMVSDSLAASVSVAVPVPPLPESEKDARLIRCSSASPGLMQSHAAERELSSCRRRGE